MGTFTQQELAQLSLSDVAENSKPTINNRKRKQGYRGKYNGLTKAQIYAFLCTRPGHHRMSEIAHRTRLTKAQASSALRRLHEERKIVKYGRGIYGVAP